MPVPWSHVALRLSTVSDRTLGTLSARLTVGLACSRPPTFRLATVMVVVIPDAVISQLVPMASALTVLSSRPRPATSALPRPPPVTGAALAEIVPRFTSEERFSGTTGP
jgi:hypothetical protein